MKKFIASILSIALLSTYGMVLNASANEETNISSMDNDITLDTIGSNNYSFNELVDILGDITINAVNSEFEAFSGGISSVFEDEYYSYI